MRVLSFRASPTSKIRPSPEQIIIALKSNKSFLNLIISFAWFGRSVIIISHLIWDSLSFGLSSLSNTSKPFPAPLWGFIKMSKDPFGVSMKVAEILNIFWGTKKGGQTYECSLILHHLLPSSSSNNNNNTAFFKASAKLQMQISKIRAKK